jgi:hypothetical protein
MKEAGAVVWVVRCYGGWCEFRRLGKLGGWAGTARKSTSQSRKCCGMSVMSRKTSFSPSFNLKVTEIKQVSALKGKEDLDKLIPVRLGVLVFLKCKVLLANQITSRSRHPARCQI